MARGTGWLLGLAVIGGIAALAGFASAKEKEPPEPEPEPEPAGPAVFTDAQANALVASVFGSCDVARIQTVITSLDRSGRATDYSQGLAASVREVLRQYNLAINKTLPANATTDDYTAAANEILRRADFIGNFGFTCLSDDIRVRKADIIAGPGAI